MSLQFSKLTFYMDNKDYKSSNDLLEYFNNRAATIVLSVCVIAIIIIAVLFGFSRCSQRGYITTECRVNLIVDSLGTLSKESSATADSIVNAIQTQQHLIDDKYKYILEQKETAQDFITFGGLFVTIALSLFGFFGYRSIESIKESSKKIAETASRETTQTILQKDSNSYLEKNAIKIINKRIEELYKEEFSNVQIQKLKDDITKEISADKQFVSENADLIKARISEIDDIQRKLNMILDDMKQREDKPEEPQDSQVDPMDGEQEVPPETVFKNLEAAEQ